MKTLKISEDMNCSDEKWLEMIATDYEDIIVQECQKELVALKGKSTADDKLSILARVLARHRKSFPLEPIRFTSKPIAIDYDPERLAHHRRGL